MNQEDKQPTRKPPTPEHLIDFAREMRTHSTDAEKRLWSLLRDRRLGGFKFRRQVPMGSYVLDFYCHEAKLVVEADGGQHSIPENRQNDLRRTHDLEAQGLHVLRFWDHDVLKHSDAVREQIYREVLKRAPENLIAPPASPHPSPLPEGEGAGKSFSNRTAHT